MCGVLAGDDVVGVVAKRRDTVAAEAPAAAGGHVGGWVGWGGWARARPRTAPGAQRSVSPLSGVVTNASALQFFTLIASAGPL